jgi:hypothetical protein
VGTHGCTSFNVHLPGMELGEATPSFNSHLCQAECFRHAAERQGARTFWRPRLQQGSGVRASHLIPLKNPSGGALALSDRSSSSSSSSSFVLGKSRESRTTTRDENDRRWGVCPAVPQEVWAFSAESTSNIWVDLWV